MCIPEHTRMGIVIALLNIYASGYWHIEVFKGILNMTVTLSQCQQQN